MGDAALPAPGEASPPDHPCRLHVYLAQAAPVGVVLRRGPSDWVRLSVWRTDTDTVEHGQWMRARVFERRADVSPDGSLFVYFVQKIAGLAAPGSEQAQDSWLAMSRPPWLTALALWWVGGTYWLGGCFPSAREVFVGGPTDPPDRGALPDWLRPTRELPFFDRTNEATDRTVFFNCLLRAGRTAADGERRDTWQRRQPNGDLTLVMTEYLDFQSYGGPHVLEYAVESPRAGELIPLHRATWADWDHRGRLVVAQHGRLLWWDASPVPNGTLHQIADFNPQTPDPAPSPPEARVWPDRP